MPTPTPTSLEFTKPIRLQANINGTIHTFKVQINQLQIIPQDNRMPIYETPGMPPQILQGRQQTNIRLEGTLIEDTTFTERDLEDISPENPELIRKLLL